MFELDVLIATQSPISEPDADESLLMGALAAAGIRAELSAWNDSGVRWERAPLTVIRSTWGYHHYLPEFLAWADHVSKVSRLLNPVSVVRENAHKSYLVRLASQGVPVVPTLLVAQGEVHEPTALLEAAGWQDFVIKPAVSAGSWETWRFSEGVTQRQANGEDAVQTLCRLALRGDVLVQPFLSSVYTRGEKSLVHVDGEFTHAVIKYPRFAGQSESVTGPHGADADELKLARQVLSRIPEKLLYARVDVLRNDAGLAVLGELEAVEPSLFLQQFPPAVSRLVRAIQREVSS
ncbi:MAG: hypothetical protein KGO50_01455 [Myxococcales bacterium]|nr:hypothetical protein [Myxococcales bacterium]